MLTTWDQVRDWIVDNNFSRWIFYKDNPATSGDKDKNFKIIDSCQFTVSDQADKLAMTEKYLRMAGGRAYAVGTGKTSDATYAEIRLQEETAQGTQGIGGNYPSIGELTATITKQVRAEIEAERMKDREKEIERREKELNAREQSAMGALVHFLAPVGQALLQKKMGMRVAGLDSEEPVHAAPIVPDNKEQEQEEESVFTDEEEAKIFDLMSRFKKIEPDYMQLLEAVVKMAESGDQTYNMAKGFLVK